MIDRDTFLITLYVKVDQFCKSPRFSAPAPSPKKLGRPASLSASEVLPLALYSQPARFLSETNFYEHATTQLRHLFPRLPDRSQFHRLVRQHAETLVEFFHSLVGEMKVQACNYEILDSTAVPVRHPQRGGRGWFAGQVDIGWSNRLGWYEGFHLLLSINPEGIITGYGFAEASCADRALAETFFQGRAHPHPRLPTVGEPAIGAYRADGGFQGEDHQQRWAARYGTVVLTPPHYKTKQTWTPEQKRFFSSLRQLVETTYAKLHKIWRLDQDRLPCLSGFQARLAAKMAMHNFCIWLHRSLGRPLLAFASFCTF